MPRSHSPFYHAQRRSQSTRPVAQGRSGNPLTPRAANCAEASGRENLAQIEWFSGYLGGRERPKGAFTARFTVAR